MSACTPPSSDCRSDFTTYFGTGITGMFVTWGNTAVADGAITASTELQIDVDVRMYGVGLQTRYPTLTTGESSKVMYGGAGASYCMEYWLMWLNPMMTTSANAAGGTPGHISSLVAEGAVSNL